MSNRRQVLSILSRYVNREDIHIGELVKELLGIESEGNQAAESILRRGFEDFPDVSEGQPAFPTGINKLDHIIGGGIRRGEFGLFAGVPESGKTRILANLAANCLLTEGLNLGYATLEQSYHSIRTFICMAMYDLYEEEVTWAMKRSIKKKENMGILQPMNFSNRVCGINDIHQIIYKLDPTPDVILIDYMDFIPTSDRFGIQDVCLKLSTIAKEFKCAIWSATQASAESVFKGVSMNTLAEGKIMKSMYVSLGVGVNASRDPMRQVLSIWKKRRRAVGTDSLEVRIGKYRIYG